jgi:hypothetical protein
MPMAVKIRTQLCSDRAETSVPTAVCRVARSYLSSLVFMYCVRIVSEFRRRSLYGAASTMLSSAKQHRWVHQKQN